MNQPQPDFTEGEWKKIIGYLLVWTPYLLLAWGISKLFDQTKIAFGVTIGVLLVLRGLFAITEYWLDAIKWQLGTGRAIYYSCLNLLRANEFPDPSKIPHDGFLSFLLSTQSYIAASTDSVRAIAAKEHEMMAAVMVHLSDRQKARYNAAMNKALLDWFSERWYEKDRMEIS